MTTRLSKPVSRLITTRERTDLIVTLERDGITFRLPHQRRSTALLVPYGLAYVRAAKQVGDVTLAARRIARSRRGVSP